MSNLLVDILKTTSHKEECVNQVFGRILQDVEDKVKRRLNEGGTNLAFDFPIVKPGLPTYDIDACVKYVCKRLHGCGLDTERTAARSLRISWDRLLREARRQKSAEVLRVHKQKKEERDRKRKEKQKKKEEKEKGPPVPPHADDPDDLFSLPSVRSLKTLADELRHV